MTTMSQANTCCNYIKLKIKYV